MADLPTKFHLTVVTRERKIIETDAVELVLPAYDGEIGVLPGHTPLLALLKVGIMRYRTNGTSHQPGPRRGGFAEVFAGARDRHGGNRAAAAGNRRIRRKLTAPSRERARSPVVARPRIRVG